MGNAINFHSEGFSVPSYLRGVVGSKTGFYLVRGGQNVFWLIDERGRRVHNPDWFQFFGLHKDDMTKGQFLSMFTLLGAVEGLEARLNGIVHGTMESRMGGQSLGGVLSSIKLTHGNPKSLTRIYLMTFRAGSIHMFPTATLIISTPEVEFMCQELCCIG